MDGEISHCHRLINNIGSSLLFVVYIRLRLVGSYLIIIMKSKSATLLFETNIQYIFILKVEFVGSFNNVLDLVESMSNGK